MPPRRGPIHTRLSQAAASQGPTLAKFQSLIAAGEDDFTAAQLIATAKCIATLSEEANSANSLLLAHVDEPTALDLLALYGLALRRSGPGGASSVASAGAGRDVPAALPEDVRAAYRQLRVQLSHQLAVLYGSSTLPGPMPRQTLLLSLMLRTHVLRCHAALLTGLAAQLKQRPSRRNIDATGEALAEISHVLLKLYSSCSAARWEAGDQGGPSRAAAQPHPAVPTRTKRQFTAALAQELMASQLLEAWAACYLQLSTCEDVPLGKLLASFGATASSLHAALHSVALGWDMSLATPALQVLMSSHMARLLAALDGGSDYGAAAAAASVAAGGGSAPDVPAHDWSYSSGATVGYLALWAMKLWDSQLKYLLLEMVEPAEVEEAVGVVETGLEAAAEEDGGGSAACEAQSLQQERQQQQGAQRQQQQQGKRQQQQGEQWQEQQWEHHHWQQQQQPQGERQQQAQQRAQQQNQGLLQELLRDVESFMELGWVQLHVTQCAREAEDTSKRFEAAMRQAQQTVVCWQAERQQAEEMEARYIQAAADKTLPAEQRQRMEQELWQRRCMAEQLFTRWQVQRESTRGLQELSGEVLRRSQLVQERAVILNKLARANAVTASAGAALPGHVVVRVVAWRPRAEAHGTAMLTHSGGGPSHGSIPSHSADQSRGVATLALAQVTSQRGDGGSGGGRGVTCSGGNGGSGAGGSGGGGSPCSPSSPAGDVDMEFEYEGLPLSARVQLTADQVAVLQRLEPWRHVPWRTVAVAAAAQLRVRGVQLPPALEHSLTDTPTTTTTSSNTTIAIQSAALIWLVPRLQQSLLPRQELPGQQALPPFNAAATFDISMRAITAAVELRLDGLPPVPPRPDSVLLEKALAGKLAIGGLRCARTALVVLVKRSGGGGGLGRRAAAGWRSVNAERLRRLWRAFVGSLEAAMVMSQQPSVKPGGGSGPGPGGGGPGGGGPGGGGPDGLASNCTADDVEIRLRLEMDCLVAPTFSGFPPFGLPPPPDLEARAMLDAGFLPVYQRLLRQSKSAKYLMGGPACWAALLSLGPLDELVGLVATLRKLIRRAVAAAEGMPPCPPGMDLAAYLALPGTSGTELAVRHLQLSMQLLGRVFDVGQLLALAAGGGAEAAAVAWGSGGSSGGAGGGSGAGGSDGAAGTGAAGGNQGDSTGGAGGGGSTAGVEGAGASGVAGGGGGGGSGRQAPQAHLRRGLAAETTAPTTRRAEQLGLLWSLASTQLLSHAADAFARLAALPPITTPRLATLPLLAWCRLLLTACNAAQRRAETVSGGGGGGSGGCGSRGGDGGGGSAPAAGIAQAVVEQCRLEATAVGEVEQWRTFLLLRADVFEVLRAAAAILAATAAELEAARADAAGGASSEGGGSSGQEQEADVSDAGGASRVKGEGHMEEEAVYAEVLAEGGASFCSTFLLAARCFPSELRRLLLGPPEVRGHVDVHSLAALFGPGGPYPCVEVMKAVRRAVGGTAVAVVLPGPGGAQQQQGQEEEEDAWEEEEEDCVQDKDVWGDIQEVAVAAALLVPPGRVGERLREGLGAEPLRVCANPGCVNLDKGSEAELARNRCAGCCRRAAPYYCGSDCQSAHWGAAHRRECERRGDAARVGSGFAGAGRGTCE